MRNYRKNKTNIKSMLAILSILLIGIFTYSVFANNNPVKENWRVNKNGESQEYIKLNGENKIERINDLLSKYTKAPEYKVWESVGYIYDIKPEVLICIAKADSSLGDRLKTKNNFGNVGNNDRGNRVHFKTAKVGVLKIAEVLNNRYLGEIFNIGYLSCGGKTNLGIKNCFQNKEKVYATSKENWNNNVLNCLSLLEDRVINEDYEFRIEY